MNEIRDAELDAIRLQRLDRILELEQQRDELLALVKRSEHLIGWTPKANLAETAPELLQDLRAAIARAEEGR